MDSDKELNYGGISADQWTNLQQRLEIAAASAGSSDPSTLQHQVMTTAALHSIDSSSKHRIPSPAQSALLQQRKVMPAQQHALPDSHSSVLSGPGSPVRDTPSSFPQSFNDQEHHFSVPYSQQNIFLSSSRNFENEYSSMFSRNGCHAKSPTLLINRDPHVAAAVYPHPSFCGLSSNPADSIQDHFQNEAMLQGLSALAGVSRPHAGVNFSRMLSQNLSIQGRPAIGTQGLVVKELRMNGANGGTVHVEESDLTQGMQTSKQKLKPTRSYTKVLKLGSIGRAVDVTRFTNYTELKCELARMFGLEGQLDQDSGWQLVFVDNEGDILLVGDDPWEVFVGSVRGIRIMSPSEVAIYTSNEEFAGTPLSFCLTTKR